MGEPDQLEVPTPLGPLRMSGKDIFLSSVIVMLLLVIGWLGNFSLNMWGTPFDLQKNLMSHSSSVQQQHDESLYVLWACLSTETSRRIECARMNLRMPDSLRSKQRIGGE